MNRTLGLAAGYIIAAAAVFSYLQWAAGDRSAEATVVGMATLAVLALATILITLCQWAFPAEGEEE